MSHLSLTLQALPFEDNGMKEKPQIDRSVDEVIPLGYDSRRYARFVLSGGGYVVLCDLDNIWFDALRPSLKMNLRDVNIRGVGLMGKTQLKAGDRLIIPSPQGHLMHANVVRCALDPLFPNLYRIGLLWSRLPPVQVFLQWEPFVLPPQLPEFHEQVSILISLSN
ncbi:hypothetical protein O23A_p0777 [Aeromonas salmonicida]|nr:hypothetical protein O23A_p0777 [Aeromonas salmonicida]